MCRIRYVPADPIDPEMVREITGRIRLATAPARLEILTLLGYGNDS